MAQAQKTVVTNFDGSTTEWATTPKGMKVAIRRYSDTRFEVYALDGHELLPVTRHFTIDTAARDYANMIWKRY